MVQLIKRLEGIAKKNKDEFGYQINVYPRINGLEYEFICLERADGHIILNNFGSTLEEAIDIKESEIVEACKEWGYKS